MASKYSVTQILALIGGVLILVDGVLSFFDFGNTIAKFLSTWIRGIILVVDGLFVFFSLDIIKGLKIPYNGVLLLILGIVAVAVSGWFAGGILVVIAAILWFLGEK